MSQRLKNRLIAKLITRFPGLAKRFIAAYQPWESGEPIPWTPVTRPLSTCRVALVTTSGVHHRGQQPFDMDDGEGDPSLREIDPASIGNDYRITHDYYDHSDAEKDLNIVLPVDRLRELQNEGVIGSQALRHFSLMGHIDGHHIATLVNETARKIIARLRQDAVDVVLLTPA
jgi:D-proline reductase (dithiol) PrdB